MATENDQRVLLSVGIDVGTATSHLVFSRLTLQRDPQSRTNKFEVMKREILFEGPIHLTPLIGETRIDYDLLKDMLLEDYREAGVDPGDVDTGAVIVTGESARRQNADEIVRALAGEGGRFVAATAGPNMESLLAAYGSGAVELSRRQGITVINVDIGGGSSNVAVCSKGRVVDTTAISVGGRLVALDEHGRIRRIEAPAKTIARHLGHTLRVGQSIEPTVIGEIVTQLADALAQVLRGPQIDQLAQQLMLTSPLKENYTPDLITFSGGVAEYIYGLEKRSFGDIGRQLAEQVAMRVDSLGMSLGEVEQRIRATVIGVGQNTLRVSGSTTYLSEGVRFPFRDLPVVEPLLSERWWKKGSVVEEIGHALKRFDLREASDAFLLSFRGHLPPSYEILAEFSRGLVRAVRDHCQDGRPLFLCFQEDIGNSVGNIIRRETDFQGPIISVDELDVREGEYVDIGEPVIGESVVPVIVKTLVFAGSDSRQHKRRASKT